MVCLDTLEIVEQELVECVNFGASKRRRLTKLTEGLEYSFFDFTLIQ